MPSYREYQVVLRPGLQNVVKRPQTSSRRSVLGCLNCKRRKVKCDETKSTCVRCQRRKETCIWPAKKKPRHEVGLEVMTEVGTEISKQSIEQNLGQGLELTSELSSELSSELNESLGSESVEITLKSRCSSYSDNSHDPEPFEQSLPIAYNTEFSGFETIPSFPTTQTVSLDGFFLTSFARKFLPPFAQVHIGDRHQFHDMVLRAAGESASLREVFIACGASFVASENMTHRHIAHKRYNEAISKYKHSLKSDVLEKQETWLFIAAQVLQVLCLREPFANSNATRCAFHFALAHKFVAHRLSKMIHNRYVAPIEKRLMENFIFHYPLVIFFCDHTQLQNLVPDPFQFFSNHQSGLFLAFWEEAQSEYGLNPLVAFHIAAKCSWSCRLKLFLDENQIPVHRQLLSLARNSLCFSTPNFSSDATVHVTHSLTSIVLNSSIILLTKMIDMQECNLSELQPIVTMIKQEMEKPCHESTVFPIWSLMIAACASMTDAHRFFFRAQLAALHERSKSKLIERILVQLQDLWAVCGAEEPFELLFDAEFMSQICN